MNNGNPNKTKENVRRMFDSIAPNYDLLNHFLSLGIDRYWRKRLVKEASKREIRFVLDVATGTCDLPIALSKLCPDEIIALDISEEMLDIGRRKINQHIRDCKIQLLRADCERLPFPNECFDLVTVAFGVRNFENLEEGLSQMYRVIQQGGRVLILEFSIPTTFPVKQLYLFYFKYLLPLIGRIVSKHDFAYRYLPATVLKFPQGEEFSNILQSIGFTNIRMQRLTFGITTLYSGEK